MVEHCDDEVLALLALGEPGSQEDEVHVQQCARCQSRVDQLAAVVAATRGMTSADRLVDPPDRVWEGIAAELGLQDPPGNVVTLRRARRTGWILAAAAAIIGVVLGSAVTVGLQQMNRSTTLVAQTVLDPISEGGVRGSASVETVDGQPVLVVSVPGLQEVPDGYYEVWMATPDTTTMVAIGTLNPGEEGRFVLPASMSMEAFPVVDVSIEHFDGDASHSAQSVVRGQLA